MYKAFFLNNKLYKFKKKSDRISHGCFTHSTCNGILYVGFYTFLFLNSKTSLTFIVDDNTSSSSQ